MFIYDIMQYVIWNTVGRSIICTQCCNCEQVALCQDVLIAPQLLKVASHVKMVIGELVQQSVLVSKFS